MEIVLATHNLHKIREFKELFKDFPHIDVLTLHNFPSFHLPEETGKTFQENALLKARSTADALQLPTLADDSGLVVPALEGAPGVHSRRYAKEDATDKENRKKLLSAMEHFDKERRAAYMECHLALYHPDGFEKCVSGCIEGWILFEERGRNGFGYDSLFVKHDYDKTLAELPESTKIRISHRAKAFSKISLHFSSLQNKESCVSKKRE